MLLKNIYLQYFYCFLLFFFLINSIASTIVFPVTKILFLFIFSLIKLVLFSLVGQKLKSAIRETFCLNISSGKGEYF